MNRRAYARALFWLGMSILVSACGTLSSPQTTAGMSASDIYQATRYDMDQDTGPSQVLDVTQVREVVPTPVTRTLAGNKNPYTVNGETYYLMDSEAGYRERGVASWYGEKFHGHRTSNGEIYDMYQLSAAHKTMPLPGFARVTNLENQRSIIVRVNDRGPFHEGRVIDLSYAAAYMLGYADKGTAMVEVEAIVPPSTMAVAPQPSNVSDGQYLQVGAFGDRSAAESLMRRLNALTTRPVFIRTVRDQGERELHRVRVGPIPSASELESVKAAVVAADLGSPYTVRD